MAAQLVEDPIFYFPRVSADIVEQLERQLFRPPAENDGPKCLQPDVPSCFSNRTDACPVPTPHDLQAGLMLIVHAGVAMNELRRIPSENEALLDIYEVVSAMKQRLLAQAREINEFAEELQAAKLEVDASRRRAEAAENRLGSFTSLLVEIISPYAQRTISSAAPPVERLKNPEAAF